MSNSHLVRFGSLLLSDGGDPNPNDTDYRFAIEGESFTTGDPQPVEVTIRSRLQDGSIVKRTRDENREASFRVVISGATSEVLAQGLAALLAETNKRNEFSWTPPDGWGKETVYDVITSSLAAVPDDLAEVNLTQRTYALRLVCEPFGRSAAQVSVAPLPPAPAVPTVTTIDAGSALTSWSATQGTLSDQGAFLRISGNVRPGWRWSGSTSLAGTPFISLLLAWPTSTPIGIPVLLVNGVEAELVAQFQVGASTRFYWQTDQTTATTLAFSSFFSPFNIGYINFSSLQKTDGLPAPSTARESQRTVAIQGTARAQGSFAISHASSGLGTVLLYTCANAGVNYSPPLRAFRAGGGSPVIDASTVSGAYEDMATSPYFEVPVNQLLPGKHQIIAILKRPAGAASQVITWVAQTYIGGVAVGTAWSGSTTVALTAAYGTYVLGNAPLPPGDLPSTSTAVVRITLAGAAGVTFDEGFILNLDIGALTWVEVGAHKRLWVDTATVDHPWPAVFIGDAADRSDAFSAPSALRAWGTHQFCPDQVSACIVTTGALSADAAFYYSPAWHYEAAS